MAVPLVCAWSVLGLIVGLLAFTAYMTFVPGLPTDGGFTLANWEGLGSASVLTRVLPNTAVLGVGAMAVASAFGLPLAWLVHRADLPWRRSFATAMALVLVVPGYATAMGWIMLGVSNNVLAIAWVMGLILVPAVFFLLSGPLASLDPALADAARASGAGPWQIARRIELPLLWPALLGALIYTFISAVSIFEVPALLGAGSGKVPVLATALFYAVRPAGPQTGSFAYGVAGVYGLLLIVPCLIALHFYLRLLARSERYAVIGGRGYRRSEVRLGRARPLAFAFAASYFVLALILPLLVLGWASLLPVLRAPSWDLVARLSLRNYASLLEAVGGVPVLQNTAVLVIGVAALATFFSFMVSWVVVRTRVRARALMDVLAMLPHAVPGLAFAFAFAMLAIVAARWVPWLPLGGTLAIIVAVDLIGRLPYGTRLANAALAQVHTDLEDAARVSGAGTGALALRVLLPLIRPSLVYLAIWTGLLTLQEVSMALFLSGPQNTVLAVSLFQLWVDGELGPAAAGTLVLTAILAALTAALLRFGAPGAIRRE